MEETLAIIGRKHFLTGSRITVDPPVEDTDQDIVVIYDDAVSHMLQSHGYVISPHEEYPNEEIKAVYRKGDINIIAVADQADYDRWECATKVAKLMNLKEKHQRIVLFQLLTEGKVRGTDIKLLPAPFIKEDILLEIEELVF